jgi:hypothetical protein
MISKSVREMALIKSDEQLMDLVKFNHDEDAFAEAARAHGFDEETLTMLAQLEFSPDVFGLFSKK